MPKADTVSTMREAMRDVNRQPMQKSAPPIQVENIRAINKGSLRAFCTVIVGGLKIHSCRIVQDGQKAAWVSLPQQEWIDRENKKRYSPIVEVPDYIKAAIEDAVLQAWKALQG